MALVTYPLNDVEYTAEDAELFHATRTSGVYASNSFGCSVTGADNNVVIGPGIGWIKNNDFAGKVIALKESTTISMDVADSVYPRIDAIVLQYSANENNTSIVVKSGVASSSPVAPEVTRTESVYELHLYHVKRGAGDLYITNGDITDLRLNSAYCGLMADSVTQIDTEAINKQVSDLISSLETEIENAKEGTLYLQIDGSCPMQGDLDLGEHRISNLAAPEEENDAVSLSYANENFRGAGWNPSAADIGAAVTATYTADVTTTWTADSTNGGYYQTVTVSGILADDNPIADVVLGTDIDANAAYLEAWGCVTRITTAANSITLWANEEAPTVAFSVQLKVVR